MLTNETRAEVQVMIDTSLAKRLPIQPPGSDVIDPFAITGAVLPGEAPLPHQALPAAFATPMSALNPNQHRLDDLTKLTPTPWHVRQSESYRDKWILADVNDEWIVSFEIRDI